MVKYRSKVRLTFDLDPTFFVQTMTDSSSSSFFFYFFQISQVLWEFTKIHFIHEAGLANSQGGPNLSFSPNQIARGLKINWLLVLWPT